MKQPARSKEQAFFRLILIAIVSLALLCLLALGVLAVARVALDDDSVLSDDMQSGEPTTSDQQEGVTPPREGDEPAGETPDDDTAPVGKLAGALGETPDRGQAYIDSMLFFGESTTAHLRSRGVLSGGKATQQVLSDASNTMMLSMEILRKTILYPQTGEPMTVEQAVAKLQPKYMVLAFGVNGLSGFVANRELYARSYAKLIGAIRTASPQTTVILQTVYPVGTSYDDAAAVNAKIRQLNEWLPAIAQENGAYLVDTASCLADGQGMLRPEFAQADGLHLTAAAYREILAYLRTHACP